MIWPLCYNIYSERLINKREEFMPCRDAGPDWDDRVDYRDNKIEQLEAALCGILATNTDPVFNLLDLVDWKEAGVSRKWVEEWYEKHKKADDARRAREKAAREDSKKRKALKAKARKYFSEEELRMIREN